MSAPPPDLVAFHLGFVVRDLEAAMDRYQRLLGVDPWRVREVSRTKAPWTEYTDARMKVAFGRAAGLTFELIQVLEGHTQHTDFLDAHGEGVQHIGFWTRDVRDSVQAAVAQGARIINAVVDPNDQAVVQLTPASSAAEILQTIPHNTLTYVDPGLATVQLEFVGAGTGLRDWLQADFERIIVPPPWEAAGAP